jgi:hypothetical protein
LIRPGLTSPPLTPFSRAGLGPDPRAGNDGQSGVTTYLTVMAISAGIYALLALSVT